MLHVFVDGDNIPIEAYLNFIKEKLENEFGTEYVLSFFCQTTLIFKYQSINLFCS